MPRILDRYIVREFCPPFLIALLIFTFTLQLHPLGDVAEPLIARGAGGLVILRLMALLVPQEMTVTLPMAVVVGLLVAFGRLSRDREYVALQSCGISLFRLLRPTLALGAVGWAATSYVTLHGAPWATREFRDFTFQALAAYAEGQMKPRVFVELSPGRLIYATDVSPSGWTDVFVSDSSDPHQQRIYLGRRSRLMVDRDSRRVGLVMQDGTAHVIPAGRPDTYQLSAFGELALNFDWDSVFRTTAMVKSDRERSMAELRDRAADLSARGQSPLGPTLEWHQRFAIPVACLVFAVVALALGVTTRNDGKPVSFVLGIAVIFAYYVMLVGGRTLATAGRLPAGWAMWAPDLLLGTAGSLLLLWRARGRVGPVNLASLLPNWAVVERLFWRGLGAGWRVPGLGILDRYVASICCRVFALVFVALLGIFYISVLTDLSDDLLRETATAQRFFIYYLYGTPRIVYYAIPLSMLIATLVTVGQLTKTSELVVMKGCGISLYRVAAPLIVLAALSSAALFGLQEWLLAESNRRAEAVRLEIKGEAPRSFERLDRSWAAGRTGGIYHYEALDQSAGRLHGVSLFDFFPGEWRLRRRLRAEEIVLPQGAAASRYEWIARDGRLWMFGDSGLSVVAQTFDRLSVALEPIGYFKADRPHAERMSYRALRSYVSDLRASGMNVTEFEVDLRRKLAFPFVPLIMTLIAVPFAALSGRRGMLFSVGLAVGLSLGYWTTSSVLAAIGKGGAIDPLLAAWAPNVLFGVGAVYLLLAART